MSDSAPLKPILVDRELTGDERFLAEWMLVYGKPEGKTFLDQLDKARVGALCPCGCASINFNIDRQGLSEGL